MVVVNRRELKYAISEVDYYRLNQTFKAILKEDKNNGEKGYTIRSLYFDSRMNDDYYAKMSGEEIRKKIRLRIYNTNTKWVKLEIKKKLNINQIKETVTITREDAISLINKDYSVLLKYKEDTARTIYNIMTIGQYEPVVLIDYDRVAYLHEENSIRVTFDSNIRSSETNFDMFSDNVPMAPIFDHYHTILEVKYDGELFCWISSVLNAPDVVYQSLSKYCSGRRFFDNYLS
ncbi:polyphosphate polymerase domain-containing protein [Clostridium sp.]|uniref:polyphosphate polymerase domain-containing protein n=1 Tax=Clostridium sp. TaxID=1506 RepID=UPI003F334313